MPLINLAAIKRANIKLPCKIPFSPKEIVKLNSINEIANPINPIITTFFRPILSLSFPQKGLNNIHAKAEDAKIEPICISESPRSLAKGGIVIKTTD